MIKNSLNIRGGGISANNLVSDFISPWHLLSQAGNLRPFRNLNDETVVEPYNDSLRNYIYTDNYLIVLGQSSDSTTIYITIYDLKTWENILPKKILSGYSVKGYLGSSIIAAMTYKDEIYMINNDSTSLLHISVDLTQSDKYTLETVAMPRKITAYMPVCMLGNVAYMFGARTDSGTSSSANTTYTSIMKFDAATKSTTVLGISTGDMGFNAGGQNSSNNQTESGVYGCFPYSETEIMIFGKNADAGIKNTRMVLYNTSTGEYKNVSSDEDYRYLTKLSMLNTIFSSSNTSIRSANRVVANDGLVMYTTSNAIAISSEGSTNTKWYLDTKRGAYIYLIEKIVVDTNEKKIYSTWLPEITASLIYINGTYSNKLTGFSYQWKNVDGHLIQFPEGTSSNNIDLRAACVYSLNRKMIKAFSLDTTDLRLRAAGAFMIDMVVVVKKDAQVKPFSEFPSPMQVRFVRPSNLSIIDVEPDGEGYYEVPEECYMYMAIENTRPPKPSTYPLDGYPYASEQPFKILVR